MRYCVQRLWIGLPTDLREPHQIQPLSLSPPIMRGSFIIFTIFTITTFVFSYSFSVLFWTQNFAIRQSAADLFLSYTGLISLTLGPFNVYCWIWFHGVNALKITALLFIHSFTHSFIHSFIDSFIQSAKKQPKNNQSKIMKCEHVSWWTIEVKFWLILDLDLDLWPWKLHSYYLDKKTACNLKTNGQVLMQFCTMVNVLVGSMRWTEVTTFDLCSHIWPSSMNLGAKIVVIAQVYGSIGYSFIN